MQSLATTMLAAGATPALPSRWPWAWVLAQPVTLTATPTGRVTFRDGNTTLGSGTLNSSGLATLSTSSLAIASHSITAVYAANSTFLGSTSATLTQVVTQDSTSTSSTSSVNPATFGQ